MRPPLRHRGLTLVELLIAMTVSLVVIASAMVAAKSQQKAYVDGQRLRTAQAGGRRALLAIERLVPQAGFGLDAPLAFDFKGWTPRTCPAAVSSCASVDSTSESDELVFLARDPRYWVTNLPADPPVGNAWNISAVTLNAVTVIARVGDVFRSGQILSAVCNGSTAYTYFTLDETVQVSTAGATSIRLKPVVTTNPFRRQDVAVPPASATENCFNPNAAGLAATPPRIFLVNRYRLHVYPAVIGTVGGATQYDGMLVLDRGVDMNLDGRVDEQDEELLAEGVESIQVSYGFLATSLAMAGNTAGTPIAMADGAPLPLTLAANTITTTLFPGTAPAGATSPYQASSFYGYPFSAPADGSPWARASNNQANIQLVRVAVLARSTERDTQSFTNATQLLPLYNQSQPAAWVTAAAGGLGGHDGYQRVVFETSIVLQNMGFRAMPYF